MELLTWLKLQSDRVLAVLALIVGTVVVIVGWIGVSGTPYIAKQVPFVVSGGIGGLMLLMVGATVWIHADLNDEWAAIDRLEAQLEQDRAERTALADRVLQLEILQEEASQIVLPVSANGSGRRASTATATVRRTKAAR